MVDINQGRNFMINKIDISNFGSFHNFDWNASVRETSGNNILSFNKLNILYGRNYSGKTTLSKIIRCLETKNLPVNYDNPSFVIQTNEGSINTNGIEQNNFDVRVYNKDFVDTNLGFLKDENGKISPFAIIGDENNAIEDEIKNNEDTLGSIENETGLRNEFKNRVTKTNEKVSEKQKADNNLQKMLKNKATGKTIGIKYNATYRQPNYNITKIYIDIKKVREESIQILNDEDRNQLENLLKDSLLSRIDDKVVFEPSIESLLGDVNILVSKKITPTKAIQELLNDSTLQSWVKTGIHHHKDKREDCAFCGNKLPSDLWQKMSEHFSKESEDLDKSIDQLIQSITTESEKIDNITVINKLNFYSSFHEIHDSNYQRLDNYKKDYRKLLKKISTKLTKRKNDIFNPLEDLSISFNSKELKECVENINSLISENNKRTESLETDQDDARENLRLSEVAEYIEEISLDTEEETISLLGDKIETLKEEQNIVAKEIQDIEKRNNALKIEIKDEKKGADKVNKYLNNYFGHNGLKLEAEQDDDTSSFRFRILRGDKPAYNLSEGECSLVSFCYFMAKLEDAESADKKLIIFIDDPISSLDSNHIFFIYSLIENLIAKPSRDEENKAIYGYEQLFISTHSLEFLKYLKKLSKPKNKHDQFLIIGNESSSTIEPMPNYLKKYITELNYLFGEIVTCAINEVRSDHHSFYNFGNNLRKFLEAFLFFKYPSAVGSESHYNDRISKFFGGADSTEAFVQRLTNEFSHLGEFIDRGAQPIDQAEISRLAVFILSKIRDNDLSQYECLLESISQNDPLV